MSKHTDTMIALRETVVPDVERNHVLSNGFLMALALTHGKERFTYMYMKAFPYTSYDDAVLMYCTMTAQAATIRELFFSQKGR